jgi:hypothetical protein
VQLRPKRRARPPARASGWPLAFAALGLAAALAYRFELQPRLRGWGATIVERTRTLPGDELVPVAGVQTTHAVTVAAPPEEVWPELSRIRHDRPLGGSAVTIEEPGRVLGLAGWGVFLLEPAGERATRLIGRHRIPAGAASLTYAIAVEPLRSLTRRRLLLRVKARAEAS